jgi:hypothetical protein
MGNSVSSLNTPPLCAAPRPKIQKNLLSLFQLTRTVHPFCCAIAAPKPKRRGKYRRETLCPYAIQRCRSAQPRRPSLACTEPSRDACTEHSRGACHKPRRVAVSRLSPRHQIGQIKATERTMAHRRTPQRPMHQNSRNKATAPVSRAQFNFAGTNPPETSRNIP